MNLPFVLGTAQFDLEYGITNTVGCIKSSEIDNIISCCINEGICCFDSAFAYGNSLDRLIAAVPLGIRKDIEIVNKFSLKDDLSYVYDKLSNYIFSSGISKFYALLIHDPQEVANININRLLDFFYKLKHYGIVNKIGTSIYNTQELKIILENIPIDIVQCPINLFDQSLLSHDYIDIIKKHGIELHARSLFLQGVLLADKLPDKLKALSKLWDRYKSLLKALNMTSIEFIMSWVHSIPCIDKWVIGVTSSKELQEIICNYKMAKPFDTRYNYENLSDPNNLLTNPSNWSIK